MKLIKEISDYFASTKNGARVIKSLPKEYPGLVIRNSEGYAVAVQTNSDQDVSEHFANSRLYTSYLSIDGLKNKYLIFSCPLSELRNQFAVICAQFLEPGKNGEQRSELLSNPQKWWEQWRVLLGNTIYDKQVYSVIAEMVALNEVYSTKENVEWTATIEGSHDIESEDESYEVKSTVKRYESLITISGQHQLSSQKRLKLYFCRMEKSQLGVSINDMKNKLVDNGYDKDKIEQQLYKLGFERGSSSREEKYKVLERRSYDIDDSFPKITKDSFKGGKMPKSIVQISYTIDLDGLEYEIW